MSKKIEGAFYEITLDDGRFCYARVLEKGEMAFFDICSDSPVRDLAFISGQSVLFFMSVYKDALKSWKKIGVEVLESKFKTLPNKFIQDVIDLSLFRLYNTQTGEITPSTYEKSLGLERLCGLELTACRRSVKGPLRRKAKQMGYVYEH